MHEDYHEIMNRWKEGRMTKLEPVMDIPRPPREEEINDETGPRPSAWRIQPSPACTHSTIVRVLFTSITIMLLLILRSQATYSTCVTVLDGQLSVAWRAYTVLLKMGPTTMHLYPFSSQVTTSLAHDERMCPLQTCLSGYWHKIFT